MTALVVAISTMTDMGVRIPVQSTSDYGHAQLLLIRDQWLREARAEIEADAAAASLCEA